MNKNGRLTHALESEPALRGGRRSFLPIGAVAAFCMIGVALAQAAPVEPAASSKPNILIMTAWLSTMPWLVSCWTS
jgi:hypothetical protein